MGKKINLNIQKIIVFHPFLFALFPILFLFSRNIGPITFRLISIMAVSICFTYILWILSGPILRDKNKRGIIITLFLLLFFSYGHLYGIVQGFAIGGFQIGRHRYLYPVWSIIFVFVSYFFIKTQKNLYNFTKILNIVAISLVSISLINIGSHEVKTRILWRSIRGIRHRGIDADAVSLKPPDIYYIILDGYVRSDTLEEFFSFGNNKFIDYLTSKGFYVASKSCSNYTTTFLSLASSLNMEYINFLTNKLGPKSKDVTIPVQMVRNNKVFQILKSKGYRFFPLRKWLWSNGK